MNGDGGRFEFGRHCIFVSPAGKVGKAVAIVLHQPSLLGHFFGNHLAGIDIKAGDNNVFRFIANHLPDLNSSAEVYRQRSQELLMAANRPRRPLAASRGSPEVNVFVGVDANCSLTVPTSSALCVSSFMCWLSLSQSQLDRDYHAPNQYRGAQYD